MCGIGGLGVFWQGVTYVGRKTFVTNAIFLNIPSEVM
jgi:hypothetical protein